MKRKRWLCLKSLHKNFRREVFFAKEKEPHKKHYEDPRYEKLVFRGTGPVSYTHLDVYKRQDYRCYELGEKSDEMQKERYKLGQIRK